jgi:hypothetical protein
MGEIDCEGVGCGDRVSERCGSEEEENGEHVELFERVGSLRYFGAL